MTRVDMEAVERMLNEATPGPWHVNLPGIEDDIRDGNGGYVATAFGAHNATLIAAAIIGAALTEFFAGLRVAEARQQGQRWLSALTEATKDLAQVYEAIGPAWFHGDVSAAEASRRKTEALERLARGPS